MMTTEQLIAEFRRRAEAHNSLTQDGGHSRSAEWHEGARDIYESAALYIEREVAK